VDVVHLLLVDDDPRSLGDIAAMLEEAAYVVATARNAIDALAVLRAGEISVDIVITDVNLPGMPAFELVRLLGERHPGVPILVMTSAPTADDEATAKALGAKAYLRKPVSVLVFLDAVARAASKRERDD